MENKEKNVNIGFFKKVWYSITNFEKYPEMAAEGFGNAIKYLIIMCAFVTIFMTINSVVEMKQLVGNLADYVEENIPEFQYEDGQIQMDIEEPIIIENVAYDGIDKIIINTLVETDEEKTLFEEQNNAEGTTVYFFKDQIVLRTSSEGVEVSVSPYTYEDFIGSYVDGDVTSFDKAQLVEYLKSSEMNDFYMNYAISAFVSLLFADVIVTMLDVLEIAVFGWLTTIIAKIKMRFVAVYNMAVYALTLSMILNIVYIFINLFTTFTITYFQVAYITIAYIYLAAVIFILKDDLIKRMEEVARIRQEQLKVKREIDQQEENKEEPSVEPREPKEKDKKEDEEHQTDGEEPKGSEA